MGWTILLTNAIKILVFEGIEALVVMCSKILLENKLGTVEGHWRLVHPRDLRGGEARWEEGGGGSEGSTCGSLLCPQCMRLFLLHRHRGQYFNI